MLYVLKKPKLDLLAQASIDCHWASHEKQFPSFIFSSQPRVNQFHSSVVAPASHHWYPDKEVLRQNLGKDLLVSDEEWQRVVDIGYDKVFFPMK